MTGWIKLHRQLKNWEWYKEPNMVFFFIHCLLSANQRSKQWRGVNVERGSFITSKQNLSNDTGMSIQKVKTSLKRLEKTHEITTTSTNKYTVITICNYETYQSEHNTPQPTFQQSNNKQITNEQPTFTFNA